MVSEAYHGQGGGADLGGPHFHMTPVLQVPQPGTNIGSKTYESH